MVHTDTTTSNPAAAAAAAGGGGAMRSSGNSNMDTNINNNTSNYNANVSSNPNNSPRIRPGNMNPSMNVNIANMNMNMNRNRNRNRNHVNTVPISGPIPNYSAMSVLQQQQLNLNMNMNMNMNNNHSAAAAAGQVPTRFHLTPTSIPPSPPIHPNNHSHTPFVPNLNTAPPGSPSPNDYDYDYGDDRTDPAFGSSSPYMRATKSAVDTALANERDRIKALELQEEESFTSSGSGTVSIKQYKMALKRERQYSKRLVGELAALKSVAVTSTLEAEINEEGRINCLMRRLDILQKEKGRIIVELEREEEMVRFVIRFVLFCFV